jgi:hypothetical protein
MREIINNIMPMTSFEFIVLRAVLEVQAGLYYGEVATLPEALSAYCASAAGPSGECPSTSQNTASGTKIDNTTFTSTGGSGQIITYGCELWQFPDGNGGYYYLYRNCKQTYIHTVTLGNQFSIYLLYSAVPQGMALNLRITEYLAEKRLSIVGNFHFS